MSDQKKYIFGPVPSRRLGRSLGVDLIPYKTCPYDCIYCQIGRTTKKTLQRDEYAPTSIVIEQLKERLQKGPRPDVITMSGSGEPTLHAGLGDIIKAVKQIVDIPVVVLTNGATLTDPQVRRELAPADLVAPNLDAGTPEMFEIINRPAAGLEFGAVVEGLKAFSQEFKNRLAVEVFLLGGMNALAGEVNKIAAITRGLARAEVQLNTVERPPAEDFALRVPRRKLRDLAALFNPPAEIIAPRSPRTENAVQTVDPEDIVDMIARRPCTLEDVAAGLAAEPESTRTAILALVQAGRVEQYTQSGKVYFELTGQQRGRIPE